MLLIWPLDPPGQRCNRLKDATSSGIRADPATVDSLANMLRAT